MDILENGERIQEYIAQIDSLTTFRADSRTMDAVERCLQRITEAASKLGPQAEQLCPGVPWVKVRRLGNVLRHDYDGVQSEAVWLIVTEDLPTLLSAVRKALERLEGFDSGQST